MVFERDGALGASVHGVGVSILAFQASVPGSSPGERNIFFSAPAPPPRGIIFGLFGSFFFCVSFPRCFFALGFVRAAGARGLILVNVLYIYYTLCAVACERHGLWRVTKNKI